VLAHSKVRAGPSLYLLEWRIRTLTLSLYPFSPQTLQYTSKGIRGRRLSLNVIIHLVSK